MVVGEVMYRKWWCGGSGGVVWGSGRWWVGGVWKVVEVCGGGGVGVWKVVLVWQKWWW